MQLEVVKRWRAVIIRISELRKYPAKRAKAAQRAEPRRDLRLTLQQEQSAAIIDNPVTMPQFTNISRHTYTAQSGSSLGFFHFCCPPKI